MDFSKQFFGGSHQVIIGIEKKLTMLKAMGTKTDAVAVFVENSVHVTTRIASSTWMNMAGREESVFSQHTITPDRPDTCKADRIDIIQGRRSRRGKHFLLICLYSIQFYSFEFQADFFLLIETVFSPEEKDWPSDYFN